jgi:DNA-binding transcriptional ArsR family regulator
MMDSSPSLKPVQPSHAPAVTGAGIALLHDRSREAAGLLKALANPDRLMLLCHLLGTERTVAELGEVTGIVQPTLSQQLGVLRNEGLVATRREGKFIHYRVASPAVRAILRTLYRLYCAPGAAPMH